MPLASSARSSLIAGAPRVTRWGGQVRIAQTRVIGWAMSAFGLGIPAAVLLSEYGGIPPDLAERLLRAWSIAGALERLGMAVFALFFGAIAAYGLFWLLWRRELTLNLNGGGWHFVSGLPLLRRRVAGRLDAAFVALLHRQLRAGSNVYADGSHPHGGEPLESWELRLAIPGHAEPLFLGEWGERAEAMAEIAEWSAILPRLTVEETGAAA